MKRVEPLYTERRVYTTQDGREFATVGEAQAHAEAIRDWNRVMAFERDHHAHAVSSCDRQAILEFLEWERSQ